MAKKKYFCYLYAIIIALSTFSGFFSLGTITYVILTPLFFVFSFISGPKELEVGFWGMPLFLLICLLSILINNPPEYFRVWERLGVFSATLLSFSPLLLGSAPNTNRVLLFKGLVVVMMSYAIASFFGYFFGINFFVRNGELLDYTEAGHFSGFTNHSMVLGPISALGGIFAMSKAFFVGGNKRKGVFWWSAALLCFGSVLLSASRGSLGGVVFAVVVAIYRKNAGRMGRFVKYSLFIIAVLAISFPVWGGLLDNVIKKNNYNISQGGIIYSREEKMDARLYEIKNNFLTGVGFCVVDENVDYVNRVTGTIEPNSSWLCVFSMTGVFGFIVFLSIFLHAFKTAYRKIPDREWAVMLCGTMGFFFVHLMIEGYVLAGGNFLCGLYWLTIGTIYAASYNCLRKCDISERI